MLRLSGCLPGLNPDDSSELIHKLITDEITAIFETAKDVDDDNNVGDEDQSVYEDLFPAYLAGTDVPKKKLVELSKMMIASKEYTPDLEIEYAINKILIQLKELDGATMETVRPYYDKSGSVIPEDFYEELWECIFWDNDYTFLDEGFTLEMLEKSPMNKQMGITGGLSEIPKEDECRMVQ